uniref:Uncharacterized protein n=1 Tax=Asparagus officinalis TaxID=4686 RepID=Q2XNY3_ASPOF|nr:hypothetical protein 10.t00033 [Asparagus officinalis]
MATIVGANSLAAEVVVTQPTFKIRVNEEIEYEFDQQKFEESASPSRSRKVSSSRNTRGVSGLKIKDPLAAAAPMPHDVPATSKEVEAVDPDSSSAMKITDEGTLILSKRTRQRRRQRLARQLVKDSESMDGIRYNEDLKSRQRREQQRRTTNPSSKAETNEWVRVKKTHSTLEERIKKRHTLLAHARVLLRKAEEMQKEETAKSALKSKVDEVTVRSYSDPYPVSPVPAPLTEPGNSVDLTKSRVPLKGRLGPLPEDRGKAPVKERLGPLKGPQITIQTGGRTNPPKKDNKGKVPIIDHWITC